MLQLETEINYLIPARTEEAEPVGQADLIFAILGWIAWMLILVASEFRYCRPDPPLFISLQFLGIAPCVTSTAISSRSGRKI